MRAQLAGELTGAALADLAGHQMVVEEGRYYTCNRLKVSVRPVSCVAAFSSLQAALSAQASTLASRATSRRCQ